MTVASAAHSRPSANPAAPAPLSPEGTDRALCLSGTTLLADSMGALYWPDEKLLVVADLHLEKGSAYAARGVLLPPYDTASTLARLAILIARYAPHLVVALGDSFHDGGGPARLSEPSRVALKALQRGREWLWIAGNHDPEPADNIGGSFADALALGRLSFRHEPSAISSDREIAGHLHPLARVVRRGHAISRRCFVAGADRLLMPAFGAYAGGLNVRNRAIAALFPTLDFTAHMLGDRRLYAVAAARCLPD